MIGSGLSLRPRIHLHRRHVRDRLVRLAAVSGFVALLTQAGGQNQDRFVGRIVDDRTGRPLAASLAITDAQGKPVEVEGDHAHVRYLRKRWCYVNEQFVLPRSTAGLNIEIRRGLETLPWKRQAGTDFPQTFRLRRWTSMADEGYLSGDTHVHYLSLAQCRTQMQAEDLEVLNLLTSDFTSDVSKFTGRLDPVSTPGAWVWVGQEFRDWQQGHINLLRLRRIIQPLEPFGGAFRNLSHPHLLLKPAAEQARRQNAVVTWAHFGDMPGAESPVDIALGLIDAVDLITQMDPLRVGLHWEPWKMAQPDHLPKLPALPGIDLYYQYLNAGFRLPIASGTDKMGDDIPVGSSRLYVKVGRDRTYDAWLSGLKAGNGFITNGPLLTFEVDGRSAGEVVQFRGTRTVTARATARSILPFTRLQVMVNGKAVASSGVPVPDESGIYSVELQTRIDLDRSSWLAARVAEPDLEGKGILPRRMSVFAHTNPVYFLRGGAKVRFQESIDHLVLYLRYTEHWFRTGAAFDSEARKQAALNAVRDAMRTYRAL